MRPRHKAAEYLHGGLNSGKAGSKASMRPRHKAAEYRGVVGPVVARVRKASMRPRHKAAEYLSLYELAYGDAGALQ